METLLPAIASELGMEVEGAELRDPWGHELRYLSLSNGSGYVLLSCGADGVQDLPDEATAAEPDPAGLRNDIVMVNGQFVGRRAPRGPPEATETPLP